MDLCSKQSFIFEIFSQESKHGQMIGENTLHFPSWSSVMSNIVQFINLYYGWLEKAYKDKFHLFSIFKQQTGLISFTVSLHYNLTPFDSPISSGVNRIECPSRIEEKTKNCLEWLNHESYFLLPSRTNSHTFYIPISILMDEFLESQFQPCHDFIPHCPDLSLNFKQQVRMVSILIYVTFKPSLARWVINYKESSIDSFRKWLHWI